MDIANSREAMREIEMDINEGADSIMIKPGMPYLDIISLARSRFDVPIFAYQVSGEYAMIRSASKWINYEKAILESMMCFKRAGADAIVTYAAMDVARLLS